MDEWKTVPKVWGEETWFTNQARYCAKRLVVEPGFVCSLHMHPEKEETFLVIAGRGQIETPAGTVEALPRVVVHLPPGTPHRFSTPYGESLELLEVSTRHDDADVVRYLESRPLSKPELRLREAWTREAA